jgi:hypothetical protein
MTWPKGVNASGVNSLTSSMCSGSVSESFIAASADFSWILPQHAARDHR